MENKPLYDLGAIIFVLVVATAVGIGYLSAKYCEPDSPIEQAAEAVIKEETGIQVDFSPPK